MGPRRSACKISAGLAPTSSAVPRKPSSSPEITRQLRSPEPPGMTASKNAIHSATVTTKMLATRSEEHTSELQSLAYLVCRLLLEKKKMKIHTLYSRID